MIIIKRFGFIIKKIIFAGFLLYFYNIIFVHFNMMLPINTFSLSIVSILGPYGLLGIIMFKYMIL